MSISELEIRDDRNLEDLKNRLLRRKRVTHVALSIVPPILQMKQNIDMFEKNRVRSRPPLEAQPAW